MKLLTVCVALATVLSTATAVAAPKGKQPQSGFDSTRIFFGGGISSNEVNSSDNGTGFQIFAGYGFGEVAPNINIDAEVGYMDTGDMETRVTIPGFGTVTADGNAQGLWATAVGRLSLNPSFDLLARAGFDFGDDDGFMIGIGGGLNISRQLQTRLEYVQRDNVDSLQLNFVFHPY